jgi:ZIP family zinc transporter
MSFILQISLIGFLAGVLGTGLGGLATFFWRKPTQKSVSLLLGVASGVMLVIVLFDLLPEAISHGNLAAAGGGVFLGLLLLKLLAGYIKTESNHNQYIETGILVGLGIAMHNFPEGLAIGAGYVAASELGLGLAVVIALHNFPEGVSMATPMKAGGWSSVKVLGATLLPGIPMGAGAFCGALLSSVSPLLLAVNLGIAGGGMLYIVFHELIPQAYSSKYGLQATLGLLGGLVGGILLVLFL